MVASETKLIRLLLVDDHEIVRIGLRTLLSRFPSINVVGEGGVAQAVSESARLTPDVVLLDIRLPDGSGFEACRQIQKQPTKTRVLVLTSFVNDSIIFEAAAAGADGYLLKEINGDALVRAIETVAAGQSILDPSITRRVLGLIQPNTEAVAGGKLAILSAQEKRVLALVIKGRQTRKSRPTRAKRQTVKNASATFWTNFSSRGAHKLRRFAQQTMKQGQSAFTE
jgi:two-component system response regulator DevR